LRNASKAIAVSKIRWSPDTSSRIDVDAPIVNLKIYKECYSALGE
jgi:hypothetical protein